jgi:SAM-dependent methyltransferase
LKSPNCIVCKTANTRLYWNRVWATDDTRVYQCLDCQALFLSPVMTEKEAGQYYGNYAEHLSKRGVSTRKVTSQEAYDHREKAQQYRFDLLLPKLKKPAKMLEIGGGYGNFIGKFVERGLAIEPAFVEANPERLNFACKKFSLQGYETIDAIKDKQFDLILMFHVLEHISEPVQFIKTCKDLLSPGGSIIIEVPCSEDPLLSLFDCNEYKNFYFQPMHPVIYNESSLRFLFDYCGLSPDVFLYEQRYGLSNHFQWLAKGRPGGNKIFEAVFGLSCDLDYRKQLRKNKKTDTIFGIFST